jgi:hypothetical protein
MIPKRCMICGADSGSRGLCDAHRDPETHAPRAPQANPKLPHGGLLGHVKSRQGTGDGIRVPSNEIPESVSRDPVFDGPVVNRYGHQVHEVAPGLYSSAESGAPIIANQRDRERWNEYTRSRRGR